MSALLLRAGSALAIAVALATAGPTLAQDAPAPVETRNFLPADFARFAPQTALDMLNQVPGFTVRSDNTSQRGLGQASGNVLLNGQRISNKSDDVLAQLRRIPAASVERIEIRDGATFGIPGLTGQVANIVAKADRIGGQYAWRPEWRQYATDPLLTRFEVSVNGRRGPLEYTLGLDNQASRSGAKGDTLVLNGAGAVTDTRYDVWTGAFDQPRVSGRFVYDGPGTAVGNLNLAYRKYDFKFIERGRRSGPTQPDRARDVVSTEDGWNYEIGGDWSFDLGPGRLKLIALDRLSDEEDATSVETGYADGRPITGDRVGQTSEESERIVRAEYGWKAFSGDMELSGEAAFNALDAVTRLYQRQPDGTYLETPFPGGTAKVEESRYESILSYGRTLSPQWSYRVAAGGEYSELSQVGAGGETRTFWRPKGEVSTLWQRDAATRVNLKLQRKVGQLNFFDFLSSVNLNDDKSLNANPDLVPPQSWEAEAEISRSHGAWGASTLRVYGHRIEDIVDFIPIGTNGQALGNIDEALRYGVEYRGTHNLDPMGWKGVRLDSRVWLQDSRVEDPLLGETRAISNSLQQLFSLSLRRDAPGSPWAFGGSVSHQRQAPVYRLTEVSRSWEFNAMGGVFVEHKAVLGHTLRFSVANVFYGESYYDRTVHAGRRTNPISFVEIRDRDVGPIFTVELRGKF